MGVSFLPDFSRHSHAHYQKASRSIISRNDLIIVIVAALLAAAAGATIAHVSSDSSDGAFLYSNSANPASRTFSVDSLTASLHNFSDEQEQLAASLSKISQNLPLATENTQNQSTQIMVNGQEIPVAQNGEVHKQINTDNGNVQINIQSNNSQSTSSDTSTSDNSTNIEIETRTESEIRSYIETDIETENTMYSD